MKKTITATALAVILTGCATHPSQIEPTPMLATTGLSCEQLGADHARISEALTKLEAAQTEEAAADALYAGASLILWPMALFIGSGGDHEAQIADAKGRLESIKAAQVAQGCVRT